MTSSARDPEGAEGRRPRVAQGGWATLAGALDELAQQGFTAHFAVVGGQLRALESGRTFGARELTIREYRRFEGVSDPDDMAIVYAVESQGGTRGTLVDAFGVYANPAIGAFLADVPIRAGSSSTARGPV